MLEEATKYRREEWPAAMLARRYVPRINSDSLAMLLGPSTHEAGPYFWMKLWTH
jgi:hypothetical protein